MIEELQQLGLKLESGIDKHHTLLQAKDLLKRINSETTQFPSLSIDVFETLIKETARGYLTMKENKIADVINFFYEL